MSAKPTYLGLLNAIALNETRAYHYLQGWIATTPDPEVREVLCTVAAREGEHGLSFAKRINELGFEVREKDDQGLEERVPLHRLPISPTSTSSRGSVYTSSRRLFVISTTFSRIIQSTSAPGSSSDATLRKSTTAAAY